MSATPIHDLTTDSTRHAIPNSPRLYLTFELGRNQWKLGSVNGLDAKPNSQNITGFRLCQITTGQVGCDL